MSGFSSLRSVVGVVMEHRGVQRVERLVEVVLLRERDPRPVLEPLADGELLEVEAEALLVAGLAHA
jgi:hypothetical protein